MDRELLENSGGSSSTASSSSMALHCPSSSFSSPESDSPLELHESDVLFGSYAAASPPSPSFCHLHHRLNSPSQSTRFIRRISTFNHNIIKTPTARREGDSNFRQSAPVSIPVWPKEFRCGERRQIYGVNANRYDEEEEMDRRGLEEEEEMVPPHVIVARSHVTFSVFEGVGRTLKGRDLRRVRNAVFRKTGVID